MVKVVFIPANDEIDVSVNPTLTVDVSDPDGDSMNIVFFDAKDGSIIGTDHNVENGGTASVTWSGLNPNTAYSWYATANDGQLENNSDPWTFITIKQSAVGLPPSVTIIQPQKNMFYFRGNEITSFGSTLIIGPITIIAKTTDEDGTIDRVEFFIDDELKHIGNE